MPDAFLDSSIVIGLLFRHAGEVHACKAPLPKNATLVCSRYVIFEVARGFLRSLIELHNASFEYQRLSELHQAAYSGQRRFRPYQMATWLGAMTDFQAALEKDNELFNENQKLELLRAKLRVWVQRGWRKLNKVFQVINEAGCRQNLPAPTVNTDGRLIQLLPTAECGKTNACRVQCYVNEHRALVEGVATTLEALPAKKQDSETQKRADALRHLLSKPDNSDFEGKICHRCGDAIICLEAPDDHVIATKNRKHFEPIALYLGKELVVAETALTTVQPVAD